VVGVRPQFIKAATVSRVVTDANMSDVFFEELEIPCRNHHFGIAGGSHGAMNGRMLEASEKVTRAQCPDCVLILAIQTRRSRALWPPQSCRYRLHTSRLARAKW